MRSCPLDCGPEPAATLTFWELKDCVQWYSVNLETLCFATAPLSPCTSWAGSVSIRAVFSSWESQLFSDAILSVSILGDKWGQEGCLSPRVTPSAGPEYNGKLLFFLIYMMNSYISCFFSLRGFHVGNLIRHYSGVDSIIRLTEEVSKQANIFAKLQPVLLGVLRLLWSRLLIAKQNHWQCKKIGTNAIRYSDELLLWGLLLNAQ